MKSCSLLLFASLAIPSLAFPNSVSQPEKKDKETIQEEVISLSPFCISADIGYFSATPGGSKDARFFRNSVTRGIFPHPSTITAEGLFSEHDLPLITKNRSKALLSLSGEAIQTSLLTKPDARYLAQIGFLSGLDPSTWKREPLNLIAVVDKSGSMNGKPLDLVKECLCKVLSQMGPEDQMSIVLYGDTSHVFMEPTRVTERNRSEIESSIEAICSAGSTNMEEGLCVGFELARRSKATFKGCTRVMQFTDERPNVGDTSADGFMGIMEAGSRDGIGQTTVGVGVQFGAELAAKVSSVRGGNLFYFPDTAAMEKTFEEEFDTMVTELAHDMSLVVRPAPGLRITGVYGIPGEMLEWSGDRSVRFSISTLFLSRKKGAIYVAFAPESSDLPGHAYVDGKPLAAVDFSYQEVGRESPVKSTLDLALVSQAAASPGVLRGRILVSEYLALKQAMTAHLTENNQEKAYWILDELNGLLDGVRDSSMKKERSMVRQLHAEMGKLAGHGES